MMLQAKPRCNLKQEMSWIFEALFYYRLLIWLWMCRERAYALCRSSKMSAALWRICRHIIGRLAIRDYIYQVSARCPLSKLLRNLQAARIHPCDSGRERREETSTNDISSKRYVKNTLRIDSKQRLPCFSRYYGVNLEKKCILMTEFSGFFLSQMSWTKLSDLSYTNNIFGKTEHFLSNWVSSLKTSEVLQR